MSFENRLINRLEFPSKNILILEDDLDNQIKASIFLRTLFEPQGKVAFNFCFGSMFASKILEDSKVDLIILDHDMPIGNGADLIEWMNKNLIKVPIITFSGIDSNNLNMKSLCNSYGMICFLFSKKDVLDGNANKVIREIINEH